MKETNLYKFSEDWDERPYRETIDVVNSTNYSPVGKLLMYNFFLSQLKELLMMEDAFRKDEALREYCASDGGTLSDERKENRPLFVLGLPRTGTTFLHSLLALDPKVRAPRKWELDNPTPRDDTNAEKDKEIRIKLSQSNNLNAAKTFAPQMLQLHDSSDVTRAEECIFVLSLFAPVKLITFLFPDHWDTVIGWDWVRVYRNYWKILQMWEYYEMKTKESYPNKGSSSSTNKRWVLKCPFHTWVIDSILEAIPHADIIWTHRNLDENILSSSNLKSAVADIFLDSRNLEAIGKGYMDAAELAFKRADKVATSLQQHNKNDNKLIYCMYNQLIQDPISTIESIYNQLGYEFTAEYRDILQEYIEKDKLKRLKLRNKAKNGNDLKKITLETYGISKEMIQERFSWCYEKYINVAGASICDEKKEGC